MKSSFSWMYFVLFAGCGSVHKAPTFQDCVAALEAPCADPTLTVHLCAGKGPAFVALCEYRATRGQSLKSFESTGQADACDGDPTMFACCGALTTELRAFCRRANDEPVVIVVPTEAE